MMHVISRPGGGCYGYWTADPVGAVGFGFGESDDGIRWRALPPPLIDWDGEDVVSSGQAEVTSVDQIGDKYYALLHTASGYQGTVPAHTFLLQTIQRGHFAPIARHIGSSPPTQFPGSTPACGVAPAVIRPMECW